MKKKLTQKFISPGAALIGDYRDWLTCWGMQRFEACEIAIFKLSGFAESMNNVFVEVKMGYNIAVRSRQHALVYQAGLALEMGALYYH
jgi:hypothetical protein